MKANNSTTNNVVLFFFRFENNILSHFLILDLLLRQETKKRLHVLEAYIITITKNKY